MAVDIIARGMITNYTAGTNINFTEKDDGTVVISASGEVSSEDTVARDAIDNHKSNTSNPHNVTAEQIGLNNVDNTADLDKPISTAVQTALDKKVNKTDVQDNLESTDTTSPLSANQGRILNEKITEHTDNSDIHVTVTDKSNWNGYATEIEQNKTDISQLFNITKGGETVSGESSYTINNAVDYPLLGLNLYGKSVQNGTPTPENPVDIVSVGDSGFDIISKNDTHFNLLSVRDSGGEIITKQPISTAAKVGNKVTFTVAANGTGLTYQWQYSRDKGMTWDNGYGGGTGVTAAYSFNCGIHDNECNYKCIITDANGVKTETNIVTLYIVSDDCEITTASIATALPLCGIPVSSGGNYTDSNGQQWVCDELIYNADGTGKIIKNIGNIIFDGSEDWSKSGVAEIDRYILRNVSTKKGIRITSGLCNTYIVDVSETSDTELGKILLYPTQYDQISVNFAGYGTSTVETFKAYLKNNPIVLYSDLIEPQEIELTAAEMTAFRQLQTFNGTTSISNNSGAEMSVKYCTNKALSEFVYPVTMGLQKQIDELKAAILSMGGNV